MSKDRSRKYWQDVQQAKQRYGVSSSRPQEKDPALRRELMSRNLGNVAAQDTDEYFKSLDIFSSVIIQRGPFTEAAGADVTMKQEHILLIDTPDALEIAMQEIACHPVIGVDFEFHIEDSYDGFLSLCQISIIDKAFVFDCLHEIHGQKIRQELKRVMEDDYFLKIFCGFGQDILRMKKDWHCYMEGAVDIQNMWLVWKEESPDECYDHCKRAVIKQLREKKRANDPARYYFDNEIIKPSAEFLISLFFENSQVTKNSLGSKADWRKRPIHPELLMYSAMDAWYPLRIFYKLYQIVKEDGLQRAYIYGVPDLKQYPKLRVHKQLSFPDSKIGTAINKWTKDLSISLDREPKQIISQQNIDKLCSEFEELTIKNQISSTSLCQLVQKFTNIHDNEKAENYLEFCLSSSKQAAEASIDCHQCGQLGHIAWRCPRIMRDVDQTKERLKDPANRVHKIKNNLRRILNWCKNKGIDPIHSNNPDICSAKSAIESIGLNWTELVGTWEASERNWEIFKQKYQWQCIN